MGTEVTTHPAPTTQDALEVLRDDHRRIEAALADCLRVASTDGGQAPSADRNGLLERLFALLSAHAQIESELFYPALDVRTQRVDKAQLDHDDIRVELKALVAMTATDAGFERRLLALAERVRSHIRFEEEKLFPAAAALDLHELGSRLAVRRGELLADQGSD